MSRRWGPLRLLLLAICGVLAVFWIYALFFVSANKRNVIGDKEWTRFADRICAEASTERNKLANFTRIDDSPEQLLERARLVGLATDGLSEMLDKIEQQLPSDEKGAAIVPMWIADYRTYIGDRRDYIEKLQTGENVSFSESMVEGIPISEKLTTFANENAMDACAPPTDVVG